jgi:serine/threonine protein kinase
MHFHRGGHLGKRDRARKFSVNAWNPMDVTAISRRLELTKIPGYELVQIVGQGGMGEVHQAIQLSLERTVAIKILKHELSKDPQFVGRFDKEGAALANLKHPHIVTIIDRGEAGETYYLVMEFVDGPSLREKIRSEEFSTAQALQTMLQVAKAVEYAHSRGVVHRDLKPENILFDEQAGGVPKVTDFGLAGLDDSFGPDRNLTQHHVAMGTATYMAPEQALDAHSAGPRADIYSMGVLLYEVLTGELPVGNFDLPSVKKPGLDPRLDAINARALKPAPEDRYPSATEFIGALEPLTKPQPVLATPPVSVTTRKPVFAWSLAAAAVVIAAVLAAVNAQPRAAEPGPSLASVTLLTDFGARGPLTAKGRVERGNKAVSLGEGPDAVGMMFVGRKPTVTEGVIDFEQPEEVPAGRLIIDVDVTGDGFNFSAEVDTSPFKSGWFEPPAEARSALMLLGENGRAVTVVISATGKEPSLEWMLGPEKRGVMLAPVPIATQAQRLTLQLDPDTGELTAVAGSGRDARVLGDALSLGPGWRRYFGKSPRLALGCLDGRCIFRKVQWHSLMAKPPPEPVKPPMVVMTEPSKSTTTDTKPVTRIPSRPKPQPKVAPSHKPGPKKR